MKQNTYVILYNGLEKRDRLMYDYENISGSSPMDAIKKRFNIPLKRLTGDAGRYADVIITRGEYIKERNVIIYNGNGARLCYGR